MINLAVFGAGRIGYVHALNAAAQPGCGSSISSIPCLDRAAWRTRGKTGAAIVER